MSRTPPPGETGPPPIPPHLAAVVPELPDVPRSAVVAVRGYLVNPHLRNGSDVREELAAALSKVAGDADAVVRSLFEARDDQRDLFLHVLADVTRLIELEPARSELRAAASEAKAALEMASVGLRRTLTAVVQVAPPIREPEPPPEPPASDPEAVARDVLLTGTSVALRPMTNDAVVMAVHNLLRRGRPVAVLVGTAQSDAVKVQLIKDVAAGVRAPEFRKHPARFEFARRYWGLVTFSADGGRSWPYAVESLATPLPDWPTDLSGVAVLVPTPRGAGRPLPTGNLPDRVADGLRGRFFGITPLERYMAEVVRVNGA